MQYSRTLQISAFSQEDSKSILVGIRHFPINKLALICYDQDRHKAEDFIKNINELLSMEVSISTIYNENIINDTIKRVNEILIESKDYSQILINISPGDKLLSYAILSSAFIYGVKAFSYNPSNDSPIIMPVLNLSYNEIISETKIKILKTIENIGGSIESLEQMEQISSFGKSLLSYHIQGAKDSKGLVALGLLDVERKDRGKISATITSLGKLLIDDGIVDLKINRD